MSVDFSAIIENFLTAELGEEVRGSLVEIARALEAAINAQLLTVTSDLTDTSVNAAARAKTVGDAIYAGRDKTKNTPHVLTWFSGAAAISSLQEMPPWSITTMTGAAFKALVTNFVNPEELNDANSCILLKEQYGVPGYCFYRYTLSSLGNTKVWTGVTLVGKPAEITWIMTRQPTDKTLSIDGRPADALAVGTLIDELIYAGRDKTKNTPRVLTWYSGALASLVEMPPWSITTMSGAVFKTLVEEDFPHADKISDSVSYILKKELFGTPGAYFFRYTLSELAMTRIWTGYTLIGDPATISWNLTSQPTDKTLRIEGRPADAKAVGDAIESGGARIRILVFGNSFSYSDLGMVPALLSEYGVIVEMGILYYSGATIQDHIDHFNNQTPYSAFSYCDGAKWTNAIDTFTAQNALDSVNWDYVVFQAGNPVGLETLANKITDYVDYPLAYLFNNNHSKGANCKNDPNNPDDPPIGEAESDRRFLSYAERASALLADGNIVLDVLPCGAAVQNARQLSVFKAVGDLGYLCHDDVGHLQNGISTLIPAYAAALKLLEIIGGKQKVFGSQVRPTDAWLAAYNIFTKTMHGASQGLSDANVLLAAKCAVQAYKHPFEITTIQ